MYENLLHQNVTKQLKSDIKTGSFPGAVMFSGPEGSGKLTCALETARILSCVKSPKARWDCDCPSCLKNKSLSASSLLLLGPKDLSPEIRASCATFLKALKENSSFMTATRYLFIRSIRKLTLRFSQVLWENDDNLNKIGSLTGAIDEELETIDFPHALPDFASVEKTSEKLIKLSSELEDSFMYDSVPVNQIRNLSSWARMKSVEGKNTVIIENADRMLESVRNALLKILEEPPEGTGFILTTSRKNSVMPTILSRLRIYSFEKRSLSAETEVVRKVYHNDDFQGNIEEYLQEYLPIPPARIKENAAGFIGSLKNRQIPDVSSLVKEMKNFEPRAALKIFMNGILDSLKSLMCFPQGTEALKQINVALLESYTSITVYNQSVQASLEVLVREILKINSTNGNILQCVNM